MISEKCVKEFCCEDASKIENYDKAIADTTQTWDCHHRLELIKTGAVVDSFSQDLIDWGIYYNRPADELIFLKRNEHQSLHRKDQKAWNKGKRMSEESRRKMSEARKGKLSPNKGKKLSDETKRRISEACKGHKHSEEARRKISEVMKGHKTSEETRRKIGTANKGRKTWITGKQHSEETRRKISKALKGKKPSEDTKRKLSEAVIAYREYKANGGELNWNSFRAKYSKKM